MDIVTKIDGSRMQIPRSIVGGVQQFSWISSGQAISSNWLALYNGGEVLVSSTTGASSANGYTAANVAVSTPGFYAAEWNVTVSGNLYKRRDIFQAVLLEVD